MIHGVNHVAISTGNIERPATFYRDLLGFDEEYARLRAAGMDFHSTPETVGGGIWATYGREPDGNVVELLEAPADSALAVVG